MKIVHFTTGHKYLDPRVFARECCTLSKHGYETHLVVPGAPDTQLKGVTFHATPFNGYGFFSRLIFGFTNIFTMLLKLKADIYHFHDVELIPIGMLLKLLGYKVIYDVHENFPQVVLERDYLPKSIRMAISRTVAAIERFCGPRFNYIVTVNQSIHDRFSKMGCEAAIVTNYPDISESNLPKTNPVSKERAVCYCGSLNKTLGFFSMLNGIKKTDGKLIIAGWFSPETILKQASSMTAWNQVENRGHVNRTEVSKIYSRSVAGLLLYLPSGNNFDAMPNKLFEYMAAGIPVIATGFDNWKKIIEGALCGFCVDPFNIETVGKTIQWILDNPDAAKKMGKNGRRAIEEKYNWSIESKKLIELYRFVGNQQ